MQKTRVIAGLAALILVPALALAQKVSYDFNKTTNFAGFKTYAHKDGTKVGQPLIDDRIVAAIDAAMAAKGFTKADATPDVVVVYHVAFDKEKDISTFSSGYGGGYGPYGWLGRRLGRRRDPSTTVRDILIGTLPWSTIDSKGWNQVVARHGRQGKWTRTPSPKARQEHHQRGEQDLQELSAQAEVDDSPPDRHARADGRGVVRGWRPVRAPPPGADADADAEPQRLCRTAAHRRPLAEGRHHHRGDGVHRG
jgi:hypothetical protein